MNNERMNNVVNVIARSVLSGAREFRAQSKDATKQSSVLLKNEIAFRSAKNARNDEFISLTAHCFMSHS